MGDGSKYNKGIMLCTDNYTLKEVILLMNILKIKFDIDTTIQYRKTFSPYNRKLVLNNGKKIARIIINKKNLNKIKNNLIPFFTNDFLYKLQ
jgi:hypothetical protein